MSEPFQLFHGDNRAILPTLPDASIDSCVCDPPYELGFMGKKWDSTGIAYDGSAEVVSHFPTDAGAAAPTRGDEPSEHGASGIFGARPRVPGTFFGDSGSAARFFYCAKADASDREAGLAEAGLALRTSFELTDRTEDSAGLDSPRAGAGRGSERRNHHPTVKPTALMRWLCRLITPPGGRIIDPFLGSGTTGRAAILENFSFTGIEREADYLPIARARIAEAQGALFAPPAPIEPAAVASPDPELFPA